MMQPQNTARIVILVISLLVALSLYLIRTFVYKDKRITEEGQTYIDDEGKEVKEKSMTLIQKMNYERKFTDIINVIISWVLIMFGVAQPWGILEYNSLLGVCITLLVGLLPIAIFGGYFFGFKLQKNDFDWMLVLHADTEDKVFKLFTVEYFMEGGVKYVKADTLKDAENENFQAVLIDVERERFWKAQLNGMELQPVFAEDMMVTDDAVIIQTHMRDGAIITTELLDSGDEREIANKESMKDIIKEQEQDIIILEDENNILKSQRKKGIITKTAERIAVYFNLFDELAGLTTSEKHASDSARDGAENYDTDEDPFDEGSVD